MSYLGVSSIKQNYEGQSNPGESKTVPDQSMSLRELLIRYAKGLPLEGQKTPIWEGEEGFEVDPETLDLAEREELAEKAREELKAINERVKDEVEKKRSKKRNVITDVKDENEQSENK
jgi:hypothetical protein